jgi:hypothetical protein
VVKPLSVGCLVERRCIAQNGVPYSEFDIFSPHRGVVPAKCCCFEYRGLGKMAGRNRPKGAQNETEAVNNYD